MPAFGSKPIRRGNRPDIPSAPAVARRPILTVPEATAYLQFRKASATPEEDVGALRVLVAHHQAEMNAANPHHPPVVVVDVGWTTLSGRPVVDVRAQDVLGRWHDDGWCCPAWETPVDFSAAHGPHRTLFDRRSHRLGGAWQTWMGPLMSDSAIAVGNRLTVPIDAPCADLEPVSVLVPTRARGLRR